MGLADAVAGLHGDQRMVGDGLHNLGLSGPGVFAKAFLDPGDGVVAPAVDLAVPVKSVG
jgi:hypothetical protein